MRKSDDCWYCCDARNASVIESGSAIGDAKLDAIA